MVSNFIQVLSSEFEIQATDDFGEIAKERLRRTSDPFGVRVTVLQLDTLYPPRYCLAFFIGLG